MRWGNKNSDEKANLKEKIMSKENAISKEKLNNELSVKEKIIYPMGLLGQNMIYNYMAMYIMFFFTDMLGLSSAIATMIVLGASFWDALNDPFMGMIADRTRSRWGKFRPYLLFGPIILAFTTIFCFAGFPLQGGILVFVSAITYILWGMAYTSCDIPIWAISSVVTHDSNQKNQMVTLGKIGGTVGAAIASVCSIMVINSFGGDRTVSAYSKAAIIIALVGGALVMLVGIFLKERIQPSKETIPFRMNIKTITCNKPLKFLLVALLTINMVNGLRQCVQMYFVVYVWGDSSLLTYIGLSLIVGMIFGMIITPKLIQKFSKKAIFIMACIMGTIFSIIPFFVGSDNILFCLIILGISFAFTGITTIVSASMLIDAIDFSEEELGFRGEGIIFSLNTFLTKLSAMLSKGILGIGLILMNYKEGQEITKVTKFSFGTMMYLIPGICFALTIIPLLFYKNKKKEEVN